MGDTDFFGRVGELESLQDAYDSAAAEMAIIYGHRRIGKTALIQKFCEGKPTFFYTAKAWKDPYQLDRFSQAVGTFCGNPQLRYLGVSEILVQVSVRVGAIVLITDQESHLGPQ